MVSTGTDCKAESPTFWISKSQTFRIPKFGNSALQSVPAESWFQPGQTVKQNGQHFGSQTFRITKFGNSALQSVPAESWFQPGQIVKQNGQHFGLDFSDNLYCVFFYKFLIFWRHLSNAPLDISAYQTLATSLHFPDHEESTSQT